MVDGGRSRRQLFSDKPALIEDYAIIDEPPRAVVLFLERLGVCGGGMLLEKSTAVGRDDRYRVAELIGVDQQNVRPANYAGYAVVDYRFPFEVESVVPEALQDWLSREHSVLRGKGRWRAYSTYRGKQRTQGTKSATWVRTLQHQPWVLCEDNERRKPGDVLLKYDPDYEDAAIAVIDGNLAERLTAEGVRFGESVPKSPVLRRLTLRGKTDMPESELAALLREAREQVKSGKATRDELLAALRNVRLRGVPLLTCVVRRIGPGGGQRSNLGGWVVALSEVESSLAEAVRDLALPIPETTTGRQALDFLNSVWEQQPRHVETIRGNLAAAYRYVLDDLDRRQLSPEVWTESRLHALVYCRDGWHPISRDVVVDDVLSPFIRRLLPQTRSIVSSAHLGDTNDQIRRVAFALGLGLLSAEIKVLPGLTLDAPPAIVQLRQLITILSLLDDRRELREIVFHDALSLRVDGTEHPVSAYVDDGTLMLVGKPWYFAVEAAGQLVEYFRLNQRGSEIPYLTGALYALEDVDVFRHNLEVLAEGLGLDLPEINAETDEQPLAERANHARHANSNATDTGGSHHDKSAYSSEAVTNAGQVGDDAVASGEISEQGARNGGRVPKDEPMETGRSRDGENTKRADTDGPAARRRAADHFRLLLVDRGGSDEREPDDTHGDRGFKDDFKARDAVIGYEASHGRQAEAMADKQPGFDVLSFDGSTGNWRRIEVKGVQGIFEEDASVVLSSRQVHDAVQNVEDGVEYWLYVVDSTETASPRVFPIPWTQYRTHLRYGFYARTWVAAAVQPTDLT